MSKNLVIVESPAKAKTIEKFLGSGYSVMSSFGHVRDLPKKGLNIDIEANFKPTYKVSSDKLKIVKQLRKLADQADVVWLASDDDREGEAIAWHLANVLKLSSTKTKRIVFHEITKTAIETAVKNPRSIDQNLVDAQQARRILDRLVGYELSPVLWKKVRSGLSAGRVQSVAVRLIVDRERQINSFDADQFSYKTTAILTSQKNLFPAELNQRLTSPEEVQDFLSEAQDSSYWVSKIESKPAKKSPRPPFTTSTLQQEAARRLGYSVRQTMVIAQKLYEAGYITYMRTDSTLMADSALNSAASYIISKYGAPYHHKRQFNTTNTNAQQAHEAIRPANFKLLSAGGDSQQTKLYQLIWRRALASQMSEALIDQTNVEISLTKSQYKFISRGEILKFDGFIKVYGGSKDDVILPKLKLDQKVGCLKIRSEQSFARPPARYTEASLVKKLEELGIGRPSTYAPTISTIQSRGYIEKADLEVKIRQITVFELEKGKIKRTKEEQNYGADKAKLLPTPIADVTTDFLVKNFADVVDFDFTAKIENEFDDVADGQEAWQDMINQFYGRFHPLIEKSAEISRSESLQARELGLDPKTKQPIFARFGRFGPMLQRGQTEAEQKPDFAPLPSGTKLTTVTLEQALEMFKLPRKVGQTEDGLDIEANIGRFGPFIKITSDNKAKSKEKPLYISIKPHDPMKITLDEALEIYQEKLKKEADKYIAQFEGGISVINGPYGPYITDGTKNARIPKDIDPKKLTLKDCQERLAKAPAKKKFIRRKKST